jgi:EAL domain-containing protein (putative c-di-GMP-specific phosphodiesterase class I)
MLELADRLEVTAICEGVETAEERDVLARLGATLYQGYPFARPRPLPCEVRWD